MTPIPGHDFGGDGPALHFAHANAYPPECYRAFLAPLTAVYHVHAIHHRPLWPGSRPDELRDWDTIAADMLRYLDEQELDEVVGVGHSLGAVVTMLAALQQPARFRALVLIEPVFLLPDLLQAVAAQPEAAFEMPLVQIALNRRDRWPNLQTAFDHLRSKSVFAGWSDAVLWDYVQFGLRNAADGTVELRYPARWEAQFYATPPLQVWDQVQRITQPTLAIRGAGSDTLASPAWRLWQERQPLATFVEVPDVGHMLPMERPFSLAAQILDYLQQVAR